MVISLASFPKPPFNAGSIIRLLGGSKVLIFYSLFALLWIESFTSAQAQVSAPYLKAATFYISVDDWADIWLNDTPIVDSQRRTGALKGPKKIHALPESLCLFKNENVLAIEVDDSTRPPDPNNDYAGIAYVLQLDFSDGTQKILSSNEPDQHRAYYIANHQMGNPKGWQRFEFHDNDWPSAKNTGSTIPDLSPLDSPELSGTFQFLSASSFSSKVQKVGEKHLFRRKFSLEISPNPNCDKPTKSPRIDPIIVTQPDQRHLVPLLPPTPTPIVRVVPLAASASISTPTPILYPVPVKKLKTITKIWIVPSPTPTLVLSLSTRIVPSEGRPPDPVVQNIIPTPTPTFTVISSSSVGQTIVFDVPPANIYMSFADGPGIYRLKILDSAGRLLRNLFELKVVSQVDAWAEWDGKDGEGGDVPPGRYYVVFSKDGLELKKISLLRAEINR